MSLDKITSEIRGFKIALLNVNGLTKHIDELKVFMANKPLDVLVINESKLDVVDSDRLVNVEGYVICFAGIETNAVVEFVFTCEIQQHFLGNINLKIMILN